MKMTKEDYNKLENAINDLSKEQLINAGLSTKTNESYRWFLFHIVNKPPAFSFRYLHNYLNDNHIDTALRKITNTE